MTTERRHFPVTELRVERSENTPTIRGHAAVFNADSLDLGGFIEQVAPGAFARSIRAAKESPVADMIHAFWNHDSGQVLASTRSGKLTLAEDETGLRFSFPGDRLTPAQLSAVEDGDMRMSFGFMTRKDEWTRGGPGKPDRRKLLDVDLGEISLVSKPAYPDTAVAVRSHGEWAKAQAPEPVEDTTPPIQVFKDRLTLIEQTL